MNAVTEYGPTNPTQRYVLFMIADNAADDGSNAWPSVETLAHKTALSERSVIRAINALVADGYLIRQRRKDTSNIYQIVTAKLAPTVSDNLSPTVSDNLSPTQVTQRHQGRCQDVTYAGDTVSPDPSLLNHPLNHPLGRESGASAPAPTPPAFQPVPQEVKRQKVRKGIKDPEPTLTATAPPAVTLLHRLTGYWPGEDITDALVDRLGPHPDETAMQQAVQLWRLNGNKPTNYAGICDWYDQLRADPTWTPQARYKNGSANGHKPAKTVSTPAPGSQPVSW